MSEELQYPTQHRRTFAIEDRATDKHIGNVMYYGYDAFLREAELGITIGDRDYWSHGYGRDTVRTTLASYTLGANLENLIYSGAAAFTGTGNALDNSLAGNSGNNVLDGGAGIDTVDYSASTAAVTVNLATGKATGSATGRRGRDAR